MVTSASLRAAQRSIALSSFASIERFVDSLVQAPAPQCFDARLIPGLGRILPLEQLREVLKTDTLDPGTTDAVWRQLAQHVREWGEPWTAIATGLAVPCLTRMAGKILHGDRVRFAEDVASEMLAAFLSALREADLAPPRLWLRLCWATWRAGVAATRTEATSELPDEVPAGSRTPSRPYGHPDLLLGRAVAAGVITQEAADIISATRLDKVLLAQFAAQRNEDPVALRRRRHRWETQLVDALRQGLLTVARPGKPATAPRPVRAAVRSAPAALTGPEVGTLPGGRGPARTRLTCAVRSGQVLSDHSAVHPA